jgi:hypothetical protein
VADSAGSLGEENDSHDPESCTGLFGDEAGLLGCRQYLESTGLPLHIFCAVHHECVAR